MHRIGIRFKYSLMRVDNVRLYPVYCGTHTAGKHPLTQRAQGKAPDLVKLNSRAVKLAGVCQYMYLQLRMRSQSHAGLHSEIFPAANSAEMLDYDGNL